MESLSGATSEAIRLLAGGDTELWGIIGISFRVSTTAILLAIYVGYGALRSFAEDGEKRARWSAIVGVIGFANVPIVYMSVTWWRTLHQPPSSPRSVAPDILWTLMLNLAAFTLVYVYLMVRRIRFAKLEGELEKRMAYNA